MGTSKDDKNLARKLYQQGKTNKFISEKLGIPLRTIQYWTKKFSKEKVVVRGKESLADPDTPPVEALPALETVANTKESNSVELAMTSRTAVRLLNLAEAAISTVESVLQNPDSSDISKLRAAQLAGKWVGLEERKPQSIVNVASNRAGVNPYLGNVEAEEVQFTPKLKLARQEIEDSVARREEYERQNGVELELSRAERELKFTSNNFFKAHNFEFNYDLIKKSKYFDLNQFYSRIFLLFSDEKMLDILGELREKEIISQEEYEEKLEGFKGEEFEEEEFDKEELEEMQGESNRAASDSDKPRLVFGGADYEAMKKNKDFNLLELALLMRKFLPREISLEIMGGMLENEVITNDEYEKYIGLWSS